MDPARPNVIGSLWKLDPKLPLAGPKIALSPAESRTHLSWVLLEVDPSILGHVATRTLQRWILPPTGPINVGSYLEQTISADRTH
jgi:hypothetical protein